MVLSHSSQKSLLIHQVKVKKNLMHANEEVQTHYSNWPDLLKSCQ